LPLDFIVSCSSLFCKDVLSAKPLYFSENRTWNINLVSRYANLYTRVLPIKIKLLKSNPTPGHRRRLPYSAPTSRRLNVVVRFPPLYSRGRPKWRDNYPEGLDYPVASNRLESSNIVCLFIHTFVVLLIKSAVFCS